MTQSPRFKAVRYVLPACASLTLQWDRWTLPSSWARKTSKRSMVVKCPSRQITLCSAVWQGSGARMPSIQPPHWDIKSKTYSLWYISQVPTMHIQPCSCHLVQAHFKAQFVLFILKPDCHIGYPTLQPQVFSNWSLLTSCCIMAPCHVVFFWECPYLQSPMSKWMA